MVILCTLWSRDNDYTPNLIYRFLINAFRQASEHRTRTVAFQILRGDPKMFGTAVVRATLVCLAITDPRVGNVPGELEALTHEILRVVQPGDR